MLCTQQCRYAVIRRVLRKMDFRFSEDETLEFDVYWSDTGILDDRIKKLKAYQRINHMPGMTCLSRKNNLARNLSRMQKVFEKEFDFFP